MYTCADISLSYRCNTPQLSAVIRKTVAVYKIVLMFVLTLISLMKVRVASLILQCCEFGVTREQIRYKNTTNVVSATKEWMKINSTKIKQIN